jgi:hypothetical protein
MDLEALEIDVRNMLKALRLDYDVVHLTSSSSIQFVIKDFGTVVCCISRMDYTTVREVVENTYMDYRVLYITTDEDISTKRFEVVWELMTAGYMRWVRFEHQRIFNNLITFENFGNRIIEERLRRFAGRPRYKYLIEQNEWAKRNADTYVMSIDPGFYDMMPEKYEGD